MVFRYPSFSQWPHAGQIWGCLLGVWMLSEGVRMVSECVRQMSEVCRCHINWKKFDYCHTNYMRPLLPVPIFVQKRPHGRYFQGGVVGFISGSTANFFVLGGQVMDIGKQWGWCWRIFLTWPRYPPTLSKVNNSTSDCIIAHTLNVTHHYLYHGNALLRTKEKSFFLPSIINPLGDNQGNCVH